MNKVEAFEVLGIAMTSMKNIKDYERYKIPPRPGERRHTFWSPTFHKTMMELLESRLPAIREAAPFAINGNEVLGNVETFIKEHKS